MGQPAQARNFPITANPLIWEVMVPNSNWLNKIAQNFQTPIPEAHEVAKKGLRVMSMAKGSTLQELTYLGIVGIYDPPRPQVKEAITLLKNLEFKLKCELNKKTQLVGLETLPTQVFSGDQLDQFSETELDEAVPRATVFYRSVT
ncbi:hypothetical protein NQ317_002593 [Molorchus minor]|uniref:Uncharacterized protein n=1 Tax=Molorchus minor TaxID=1323400 RepID=A0ABQ9JUY5_9CUCU|nr:hypothetical protein NQ317_002593 [Molorchus minor]